MLTLVAIQGDRPRWLAMVIKKGMKGWLSLREVAEKMEISVEAARQLVCRGTLPHRRVRSAEFGGFTRIEVPLYAVADLLRDGEFAKRRRGGTS